MKGFDSRVVCPRLHVARSLAEHLACPYCFGKARDVAEGDRRRFCDYLPDVDPVSFGFPGDGGRFRQG